MILNRKNLERYLVLKREIDRINRKIDYYAKTPIHAEHGVVKGSMGGFPYAECHFVVGAPDVKATVSRREKVQSLIIELGKKKKEYEEMQLDIDIAIESIQDAEIRQIIQRKYIENWTDAEIGKEWNYDRSTISKKLNKFLENQDSHNSHP